MFSLPASWCQIISILLVDGQQNYKYWAFISTFWQSDELSPQSKLVFRFYIIIYFTTYQLIVNLL